MMMVDDGGGRGVKNGRKSDDVINGRPPTSINVVLELKKKPLPIIYLMLDFQKF